MLPGKDRKRETAASLPAGWLTRRARSTYYDSGCVLPRCTVKLLVVIVSGVAVQRLALVA